jgi:endonuclease/exonuclease/phosphatase (EEP) superfamily protein YafD
LDLLERLAVLALWAAAAAGLVVAAASFLAGLGQPWIDIWAQFAAPVLTLCGLCLIGALALRRWMLSATLTFAGGALLFALHGQWFPVRLPAQTDVQPARVYFANVWNQNQDIDRIARSVSGAQPDVAAMVEFADQHAAAQSVLFQGLPYRITSPGNPIYTGKPRAAIASRWPLTPLMGGATTNFNILAAEVHAPFGPFRLVVVHTTRPWPFKKADRLPGQIVRLEGILAGSPSEPTLVVGDFNSTLTGSNLKGLMAQSGLKPAPAVIGDWPWFLPGPFRIAIENAFSNSGLTILSRRIEAPTGSDHRPILLEVAPSKRR